EVAARSWRECRTTASTGPGQKSPRLERREARVLKRGRRGAQGRIPRAGQGTQCRVLAAPGRLSALRHPQRGGIASRSERLPGKGKRGRERDQKKRALIKRLAWSKRSDGETTR